MATGRGSTLGRALVDLLQQGALGGPRASYDRIGWRAQFSQLAGTQAGYRAMEAAGLSATIRTQRAWLSGDASASRENQSRIREAYQAMARGGIDRRRWENTPLSITGRLTQGNDSRVRGVGRHSPLRLQYPGDPLTDWTNIADEFNDGADPDRIEQAFINDVVNVILGTGSFPWEFNGTSYEVRA